MKLFVGLGNPGGKFAANRHNVGFMAVDQIAAAHDFGPWRKRFQGLCADGTLGGEKVLLLKPQTFMNESGRSVGEAARFFKLELDDTVVFYDEIDLVPGKLKVKSGGGNAGHNGLRSISALVGNDYARVRIGVGHPGHKDLVANYVLHDFAKADRDWLEPLLGAIASACGHLAKSDSARFAADVSLSLRDDDDMADVPGPGKQRNVTAGDKDPAKTARKVKPAKHPAGEGHSKRQNALAENLQKWLKGRKT